MPGRLQDFLELTEGQRISPCHRSHIGQVEKALGVLGRRLEVRVKAA